jgi:hypothetical protein
MKRRKLVCALLITWGCVAFQHFAMAESPPDLIKSVTKLARANDWMSDEMLEEVKHLRASANEHFLIFAQIIETTQEDAVLNTAMSIASEAATSHKPDLSEIASKVLSKRSASLFPLATQRALAVLGASGDKKHIPQIKIFASNPQILIRTAAESALTSLERTPHEESGASAQKSSFLQPSTPKKASEAKPTPTTPIEEPAESTPWSLIVVLIVAALGLLCWLLKRRP